jgi:hypothetical protein
MTARMHTRTIVLALLAACAGLGLYAATARAEFETSFDVTVDQGSSGVPVLNGLRPARCTSSGGARAPGSRPASGRRTAPSGRSTPSHPRGTITTRWKAGGELGPIAKVAAASTYVSAPQVAFDSTGTALYAVARTDGLKLRRMAPDGVLSAVQDLPLRLGDLASDPRIAVSADGAAQIVWAVHSAEDGTVIETRHRCPNGLLSEVRILPTAGARAVVRSLLRALDRGACTSWESRSSLRVSGT